MSNRLSSSLATALLLAVLAAEARADFLIFDLAKHPLFEAATAGWPQNQKEVDMRFVLVGRVVVNPGEFKPLLTYTHPNGTRVFFALTQVKIFRAPTFAQMFNKRLVSTGNAPEILDVGLCGLKQGLLSHFTRAVDKMLELEPGHQTATRIVALRKQFKEPLSDDPEKEKMFRSLANREGMRLELSNHFVLLTDTDRKPPRGRRRTPAQERLDLLERAYESFVLLFHAHNVPLEIPKERLMVVLLRNHDDFLAQAQRVGSSRTDRSGFWDPVGNVTWFEDRGTSPRLELLGKLADEAGKSIVANPDRTRDAETIRYTKILDFLLDLERENLATSATSRFASQQIGGNTGLLPREAPVPQWVRNGLADYFEIPADNAWGGFGAVTESRLKTYQDLADQDRWRPDIDVIVGDDVLATAKTPEDIRRGSIQAWALTHFQLENHLPEMITFYRLLGEQPSEGAIQRDGKLSPGVLRQLFGRAFDVDRTALNDEWQRYMRTLKTDRQKLEEAGFLETEN